MNVLRYSTALALFASALALAGCSSDDPASGGSGGNGGGSGGSSGAGGSGGGGGQGNSDAVTPLAESAIVFLRFDGAGNGQIYGFDTATKQEWLIHELKTGDLGTNAPNIALSPDRKWVAMTGFFQPTEDELKAGKAVRSLWKISVDGKQTIRLTSPLPAINHGTACTVDADCASTGWECYQPKGQCAPRNFSVGMISPAWTRDGSQVWVGLTQYWNEADGSLTGGTSLSYVSSGGGTLDLVTLGGCQQYSNISFRPGSDEAMVLHTVCSGSAEGVYRYKASDIKAGGTAISNDANLGTPIGMPTPAWTPTGDRMFYSVSTTWDTTGNGQPDKSGVGIASYDPNSKTVSGWLPPLKDGLNMQNYTVTPDGKMFVFCVWDQKETYNLFGVELNNQNAQIVQLTTDGKSCNPKGI